MAKKKRVRLQDIAEKTGYSISTVSHVINKTRNVDEMTKTLVLNAIQELGYQIPSKRRQLAKSLTIGVIIADIRVDFFDELIRELEDIAYEEGFHIVVMDSEENPQKERYCIKKLIEDGVAGIILAPSNTTADLTPFSSFPIVQVDRMLDSNLFDFVGIDNMMITYQMTRTLLVNQISKIGLITFTDVNYCARERQKGYRLAMMEAEVYHPEHTLTIACDADSNQATIATFIRNNPSIDTLICTSSNICYEVLGEIKRLKEANHIRNLCTFDNNKWLDHLQFPVDAVTQPITDIAITAIELLQNRILNPTQGGSKRKILVDCTIEARSKIFATIEG